jgi:heme exporter protein A
MTDVLMVVENAGHGYSRPLFSGLNLRLAPAACLVVTGPNGSGKSTLLKCLAGLIPLSEGRITWHRSSRVLGRGEAREYIGAVFPDMALYKNLTGKENLLILGTMGGYPPDHPHCDATLAALGLTAAAAHSVATYSTGMLQRLRFALLAYLNPPVWLVDEGLLALDETGRDTVLRLWERALGEGRILVLATNEKTEVSYATAKITLGSATCHLS